MSDSEKYAFLSLRQSSLETLLDLLPRQIFVSAVQRVKPGCSQVDVGDVSSNASAELTPLVDSLWIPSQKVDSLY